MKSAKIRGYAVSSAKGKQRKAKQSKAKDIERLNSGKGSLSFYKAWHWYGLFLA